MEWDVKANFVIQRVLVNHFAERVINSFSGAKERPRFFNDCLRAKMLWWSPILLILCFTLKSRSTDFLRCAEHISLIGKGFFCVDTDVSDLDLTLAALLVN